MCSGSRKLELFRDTATLFETRRPKVLVSSLSEVTFHSAQSPCDETRTRSRFSSIYQTRPTSPPPRLRSSTRPAAWRRSLAAGPATASTRRAAPPFATARAMSSTSRGASRCCARRELRWVISSPSTLLRKSLRWRHKPVKPEPLREQALLRSSALPRGRYLCRAAAGQPQR